MARDALDGLRGEQRVRTELMRAARCCAAQGADIDDLLDRADDENTATFKRPRRA